MTLFEELCRDMGIGAGSEAEEKMNEIVTDMIFEEPIRTDDEMIAEAKKRFAAMYK
ncbi:MAG: hypothetical protein IJG86_00190 [Clostridia bacterium]|nr:hypothetical protein [Clostridia bacterium]